MRRICIASLLVIATMFGSTFTAQACTFPAAWVRDSPPKFRDAKFNEHLTKLNGCVQNDLSRSLGQPGLVLSRQQLNGLHKYAAGEVNMGQAPQVHFGFMLSTRPYTPHTMVVTTTVGGRQQRMVSSF